jgi:glutamate 5-kinase
VATEELSYGDNDHLAALVASMLHADLLVVLSDVDGLYDGHPDTEGSTLVRTVADVSSLDPAAIGGTGSFVGSGGMRTKVESARVATASGAHAVIASSRHPDVVTRALAGEEVGTWFVAGDRREDARRLWIGFALNLHGTVHVDAGAAAALRERGVSLLGVGITSASGTFEPGDCVEVVDPEGHPVARGLVNYGVDDVRRLAGRTTAAAAEELGRGYAREVVHRDDLYVLR